LKLWFKLNQHHLPVEEELPHQHLLLEVVPVLMYSKTGKM
jgi:hypothetical protein